MNAIARFGPALERRVTGDEYMIVLQQRADAWLLAQSKPELRYPPLLEWFVRDEDADLVDLPEPERTPKPKREPRYYRPASYWRDQVTQLEARMAPLSEPIITDRAAAGGCALGPKRTARIQAREDRKLQQYVALRKKLERAQHMLRSAEAREAKTA